MKKLLLLFCMLIFTVACSSPTEPISPPDYSYHVIQPYQHSSFGNLPDNERIEIKFIGKMVDTYYNGAVSFDVIVFQYKYGEIRYKLMEGKPVPFKFGTYTVYFDYCCNLDHSVGLSINKIAKNY